MPTINVENKAIYFETQGSGQPLVLLHGFCEQSTVWQSSLSYLEDYRVIRIDLPGTGRSDALEQGSVEGMADAVYSVLNHLNIDSCLLVAHSMGGYVGLALVEKYPHLLSGLCLFHSHPFADDAERREARERALAFVDKWGTKDYVQQVVLSLFAKEFKAAHADLLDQLVASAQSIPLSGIQSWLVAMRDRPDRTEVLRQLNCPVLFIIGKLESTISYEKCLEALPLAEVVKMCILPEVNHMGMFEAPDQCWNAVTEFAEFCHHRESIPL